MVKRLKKKVYSSERSRKKGFEFYYDAKEDFRKWGDKSQFYPK